MSFYRSKRNSTSLHVSTSPFDAPSSNVQRGQFIRASVQLHLKHAVHLELSSDPIEDSSSDADSFGIDDMYGTDSGIESISMSAVHPQCTSNTDETAVCIFIHSYKTDSHTPIQEGNMIHMFDHIELNLQIQSAMLNAFLMDKAIDSSDAAERHAASVSSKSMTSNLDGQCSYTS